MSFKKKFEKVVTKGGLVKDDKTEKKWVFINMRFDEECVREIDEAVSKRSALGARGRSTWIREAVEEKLRREKNQ